MKLTKSKLRGIIKEELSRLFEEEDESQGQGGQGGYPRPQSQDSQDTEEEKRAREDAELDKWENYSDVVDMWAKTLGSITKLPEEKGYDKLMPFLEMLTHDYAEEVTDNYASLSSKKWEAIKIAVKEKEEREMKESGKSAREIRKTLPSRGIIQSFQNRKRQLSKMGYSDELSYEALLEAIDDVVDFGW